MTGTPGSSGASGASGTTGAPIGTVTCLFTDIEGSTRLEIELGTGPYRDIRERHRELVRAAFNAHGGYEQGTEGDSFFVIFRGATDAVMAAADAQRAMAAEPWPDGVVVRVRMGLHTGDIEATGADVIGYAINRTARIAAVAHGGQVLLSDQTRSLVAGSLPDGITLRDLGEHRLKDLRAPERLAQLVIDGVPDDFPPLRSLDARPNNLPTQLTTFVGRDKELGEAVALLAGTRLLSLTGPGGTGKTRLSLQVAAAAADEFPDGIWFVALEPVRDPTLVAATIARVLGVADSRNRPAVDTLADHIGEQRMLLVLDNFEQVVAAGSIVADLLRRCPNLGVPGHDPHRAAGVGRTGVPGAGPPCPARHEPAVRGRPAQPPSRAARVRSRRAQPVRGGPAVHRARIGGQARVRGHERERPGRRRDLRPAARDAPRDRAGGRAHQAPDARPDPRAAGAPPRAADRGFPRPAGAAADPARRDRVELRPARRWREAPRRPPVRLPRGLGARDGRDRVRPVGRARDRRVRRASARSSTRAWCGSTKAPATGRPASPCSTRSASTPPRCWPPAGRPTRSPSGMRTRCSTSPSERCRTWPGSSSATGSIGWSGTTTTCAQRSNGPRRGPTRTWARGWGSRCGGSGSSAAT